MKKMSFLLISLFLVFTINTASTLKEPNRRRRSNPRLESPFPPRRRPSVEELVIYAKNVIDTEYNNRKTGNLTPTFEENQQAFSTIMKKIPFGDRHKVGEGLHWFSLLPARTPSPFGRKKKRAASTPLISS